MKIKEIAPAKRHAKRLKNDELLQMEAQYCSWGDTVHYAQELNIFERCEGIYLIYHQERN